MNEESVECIIRKEKKEIIVKKQNDWLTSTCAYVSGVGNLSYEARMGEHEEELLVVTMDYWQQVAKEKNLKCIGLFERKEVLDKEVKRRNCLEGLGFCYIEEKFEDWMGKTGILLNMVWDHQPHAAKDLYELSEEVFSFLEEKKKEQLAMDTSRDDYKDFYLGEHLAIDQLDIYYQGLETELLVLFEEGEWFLEINGKKEKANNKKEAKEALSIIFQKLDHQQRIKNIYEVPNKHLYRYLEEQLSSENREKEILESIHQLLLQCYSFEEIEVRTKQEELANKKVRLFFQRTEMVRVMDFVFIVNRKGGVVSFPLTQKEKAIAYYKKTCEEELQEALLQSKTTFEKLFE